jgi:hypothetical protein
MTVSFFGSNISPNDIQEVIFMMPELAGIINSFCLETVEDAAADKQLAVSVELMENTGPDSFGESAYLTHEFFTTLAKINQDFKAAFAMAGDNKPTLRIYRYGASPFANGDVRIKAKYIRTI